MTDKESPYYKQGYKAFKTDQACAYSPMSTKGELWQTGYDDASDCSDDRCEVKDCDERVDPDSVSIEDSLNYPPPDEELD
jgi:hypothetical protein